MNARDFILAELSRKGRLPPDAELDGLDYHEAGYVDSMGLIKFVSLIEREFNLEFSEAEVSSPAFRVVGSLCALIEEKQNGRAKVAARG